MLGLVHICLNRRWIVASQTTRSMPYLVDGNNLAHALGLSHQGLADRAACARLVGSFCSRNGSRSTIVFDGPPSKGPALIGGNGRVQLIFSGSRTADETILRLISSSKAPRDLTVVTSDKSLGDKARHQGAALERAHEFARRLRRSTPVSGPLARKGTSRESPAQIAEWLSIFDPARKI